jgi:hypothetical protein
VRRPHHDPFDHRLAADQRLLVRGEPGEKLKTRGKAEKLP